MMKFFTLVFCCFSSLIFAQSPQTWVYFESKSDSPFRLDQPQEFLTQRAIERREKQNIPIVPNDLPVVQSYVETVRSLGFQVKAISRWENAIVVDADLASAEALLNLNFVKSIKPVQLVKPLLSELRNEALAPVAKSPEPKFKASLPYGPSFRQIDIMNGVPLHDANYLGQGMVIAVLDAGFWFTNTLPVFDSLYNDNRILGVRDFVSPGNNVYQGSTHGTSVLSLMAGYMPDSLIGTAPKASYYLLRTEDASSETLVEEYNWLMGAEYADSVGADIINSSLGYTTMDDPNDSHTYADMDGNTTVITKAADQAAAKGILVVNSAGNSGLSSWRYIGAPADGDSVLALGAVNMNAVHAPFSSHGPSFDGRVKPNVSCQGQDVYYANLAGGVSQGAGTSFASPLCAGMAACLWQANPSASNMDILEAIEISSHMYENPDTLMGHGIPNFALILSLEQDLTVDQPRWTIYPNPAGSLVNLEITGDDYPNSVQVYDLSGRMVLSLPWNGDEPRLTLPTQELNSGLYLVQLAFDSTVSIQKLIIE